MECATIPLSLVTAVNAEAVVSLLAMIAGRQP